MNIRTQLGGPLSVVDDLSSAVTELRDAARSIRPRLEAALDALPPAQQNIEAITGYMPWLIGAIGCLGMAIVLHAVTTARR